MEPKPGREEDDRGRQLPGTRRGGNDATNDGRNANGM